MTDFLAQLNERKRQLEREALLSYYGYLLLKHNGDPYHMLREAEQNPRYGQRAIPVIKTAQTGGSVTGSTWESTLAQETFAPLTNEFVTSLMGGTLLDLPLRRAPFNTNTPYETRDGLSRLRG